MKVMAASRYPAKSRYSFTAQFRSFRSLSFTGPNAEILTSRLSCWLNPSFVEASGRGPVSSSPKRCYNIYSIESKWKVFQENAKALCRDALVENRVIYNSKRGHTQEITMCMATVEVSFLAVVEMDVRQTATSQQRSLGEQLIQSMKRHSATGCMRRNNHRGCGSLSPLVAKHKSWVVRQSQSSKPLWFSTSPGRLPAPVLVG
jgi:hypothetical protein